MIDSNAIIGLLTGSLATLVGKEVINQINKKQDFKRELIKLTYVKKLEKAENAVAYYWTYISNVTQMKKSLEVIAKAAEDIEEKNDKDIEIIQQTMNNVGEQLLILGSDKYSHINSIHLYFDLTDDEVWNEADLENMIRSLSETKSLDNEIKFWGELYDNANKNNDPNESFYWNKSIEILPKYIASLQNFIDCLEKNKIASSHLIHSIKTQLKRY